MIGELCMSTINRLKFTTYICKQTITGRKTVDHATTYYASHILFVFAFFINSGEIIKHYEYLQQCFYFFSFRCVVSCASTIKAIICIPIKQHPLVSEDGPSPIGVPIGFSWKILNIYEDTYAHSLHANTVFM